MISRLFSSESGIQQRSRKLREQIVTDSWFYLTGIPCVLDQKKNPNLKCHEQLVLFRCVSFQLNNAKTNKFWVVRIYLNFNGHTMELTVTFHWKFQWKIILKPVKIQEKNEINVFQVRSISSRNENIVELETICVFQKNLMIWYFQVLNVKIQRKNFFLIFRRWSNWEMKTWKPWKINETFFRTMKNFDRPARWEKINWIRNSIDEQKIQAVSSPLFIRIVNGNIRMISSKFSQIFFASNS